LADLLWTDYERVDIGRVHSQQLGKLLIELLSAVSGLLWSPHKPLGFCFFSFRAENVPSKVDTYLLIWREGFAGLPPFAGIDSIK
jgi:hypothetical protein